MRNDRQIQNPELNITSILAELNAKLNELKSLIQGELDKVKGMVTQKHMNNIGSQIVLLEDYLDTLRDHTEFSLNKTLILENVKNIRAKLLVLEGALNPQVFKDEAYPDYETFPDYETWKIGRLQLYQRLLNAYSTAEKDKEVGNRSFGDGQPEIVYHPGKREDFASENLYQEFKKSFDRNKERYNNTETVKTGILTNSSNLKGLREGYSLLVEWVVNETDKLDKIKKGQIEFINMVKSIVQKSPENDFWQEKGKRFFPHTPKGINKLRKTLRDKGVMNKEDLSWLTSHELGRIINALRNNAIKRLDNPDDTRDVLTAKLYNAISAGKVTDGLREVQATVHPRAIQSPSNVVRKRS